MSEIKSFVEENHDSLQKELGLLVNKIDPYKNYGEYKETIRQVHKLDRLLDLMTGHTYRNRPVSKPVKKFFTYRSVETNLLAGSHYQKGSSRSLAPIKEELCIYIAPSIGSTGKLGGHFNLFSQEVEDLNITYPESHNHLMIAWSFELPPRRNASRHRDSWITAINEIKLSLKGLSDDLSPIDQGLVWLDSTKFMLLFSKYRFEDLKSDLSLFETVQARWNQVLDKIRQLDTGVIYELQGHCKTLGFVTKESNSVAKEVEIDDESTHINCPDNINTIYYGPPGTGKTFRLKKFLDDGNSKFITFHQSYSYEDFVEGIKPKLGKGSSSTLGFDVAEGIFKKACEEAYKLALRSEYDKGVHSIDSH